MILCKFSQIFFLRQFKNNIIFYFVIFVATKKGMVVTFRGPLLSIALSPNQDPHHSLLLDKIETVQNLNFFLKLVLGY
jgi:hypothetical protein